MEDTIKNQITEIKETYSELSVGQLYDHGIEFNLPGHQLYIAYEDHWFYSLTSNITCRVIEEEHEITYEQLYDILEMFTLEN